jgi:hypothetical protein
MEPLYLDVLEPQRPFFEIWADGIKMADLIEPAGEEMFWCSYKLIPASQSYEQRLREFDFWNECKFEIRSPVTLQTTGISFAGCSSFKDYCEYKTDRIDFRSLWPEVDRLRNQSHWGKLSKWFLSFWNRPVSTP